MARSNVARIQGDDYQARWFWMEVCRLFLNRAKVYRVAYEDHNIKSFDDVVTYYQPGMIDEDNCPLSSDHYQVKFHTTAAGAVTWQGLMDPAFINADSVSILQRIQNARAQHAPDGRGSRFVLYSPWPIHPDNPLAEVVSKSDGRVIWSKLAEGGQRSKMGKIRAVWRNHLGLVSDEELRATLLPLRIRQGPTMNELRETLNDKLQLAGLEPVIDGTRIHQYDELTRKLLIAGCVSFTRDEVIQVCKQEGLWRGSPVSESGSYRVGIRSFQRWAEHLEDETDCFLDLLDQFDGRRIIKNISWQTQIFPLVDTFLREAGQHRSLVLYLHAHASIAFVAGYCLDTKSGVNVVLVQSTISGRQLWIPAGGNATGSRNAASFFFEQTLTGSDGNDVALALSLARDVVPDVKDYTARKLPKVGRIITARLSGGPSNQAVQDGPHAALLAQEVANYLKTARTTDERRNRLHLFAAAPNGLLFLLGRLGRDFGKCTLYEYDFGGATPGVYSPSVSVPLPTGS